MTDSDEPPTTAGEPPGAPGDREAQDGETPGRSDRHSSPAGAPDDPPVCTYCGARFVDEDLLALHRGLEHEPRLDEAEREAYADAAAAEREDLRLFRLQALVALLVIYFGFVLVYAFVL